MAHTPGACDTCADYKDGKCTSDDSFVNKHTGEPMCKHNPNAVPISTTRYVEIDSDWNLWQCEKCEFEWHLMSGTPPENEMSYCPRCGRKIVDTSRGRGT